MALLGVQDLQDGITCLCCVSQHSPKVMEEIPAGDPSRLEIHEMTGSCFLDRAVKGHQSWHPRTLKNDFLSATDLPGFWTQTFWGYPLSSSKMTLSSTRSSSKMIMGTLQTTWSMTEMYEIFLLNSLVLLHKCWKHVFLVCLLCSELESAWIGFHQSMFYKHAKN